MLDSVRFDHAANTARLHAEMPPFGDLPRASPPGPTTLWADLLTGGIRAGSWAERDGRLHVDLVPARGQALDPLESAALELTVHGRCYKALCTELGLSLWRARATTLRALELLGVPKRVHAVWLGTALLGQSRGDVTIAEGRDALGSAPHAKRDPRWTVEVSFRPGLPVTAAERRVALSVCLGQSDKAIARARSCSRRTVANQVRALGLKLGASGRLEIVRALLGTDDPRRCRSRSFK